MTMLADQVDLVIGVDTHKHTNTRPLCAATGGVLEEMTVPTDLDGHRAFFEVAAAHGEPASWAIEGTSSYGAGITRFLREQANG